MPDMPRTRAWGSYTDSEGYPLSEDYENFISNLIKAEEDMVELTRNYVRPRSDFGESWFEFFWDWNEKKALDKIYQEIDAETLSEKDVIQLLNAIWGQIPINEDNWKSILLNAYSIMTAIEGSYEATDMLFQNSTTLMWWTVDPGEFSVSVWVCWAVADFESNFPCPKSHLDFTLNRRTPD
jgi:hypothetical protein